MAAKLKRSTGRISEKRCRKWTEGELKEFAEVLAEDHAFELETLALKKSSNDQIFKDIKEKLDFRLSTIKQDEGVKGQVDTSIPKLRKKYKWLKQEWRKISDRAKKGSGKGSRKEPEWYKILNVVFSETYTNVAAHVATSSRDLQSEEDTDTNCSTDEESTNTEEHTTSPRY